ncbi:MAG: pantoate--beta-alanine ligase [Betaproteobacteria bacterium]|nr:pantoate--beta-alanine ligase [Betaproteobacteria bacterium]
MSSGPLRPPAGALASRPEVIRDPAAMSAWADAARARGERIAFVPTMGALHAGHVSLLEEARRRAPCTVISIFVNPAQFGPNEDLAEYPRDLDGDLAKAAAAGIDAAFTPEAEDMYPQGAQTWIDVRHVSRGLCGDRRPGHFAGVATVVCKLFHMVRPHIAVFGQKDYQQLCVVRQMVRDLDIPVEIVGMPTVREPDGLAMSSRNAYLSPAERARSLALVHGLRAAEFCFAAGERAAAALVAAAHAEIAAAADRVDYVEIRDAVTLAPLERVERPAVLAVAAFVGATRLIDNVVLG